MRKSDLFPGNFWQRSGHFSCVRIALLFVSAAFSFLLLKLLHLLILACLRFFYLSVPLRVLKASGKLKIIELTLKHFLYIGFIRFIYQGGIGKVTFPLGGFFRQDVAFESMLPFDPAGARYVKSFLGAGFRFHFWH
jgi:hypothetical protein